MKKKPVVWLARDEKSECVLGVYVISLGIMPTSDCIPGVKVWRGSYEMLPIIFEDIAPKSCHLKPGEGPIKISVKMERVK